MMFPIGYPIEPVKNSEKRPFWSVMIPTYNDAEYLQQTLKSVLIQDPGPDKMQIMVVDDASTRVNSEQIVKEIGQGRIEFYRQPQNLGQTGNWNSCLELARGKWIHLLHDDDLILPEFYLTLEPSLKENQELGAALCRFQLIDDKSNPIWITQLERETAGILENFIDDIAINSKIQPPAIVVKREVYEKLGGFHPDLEGSADWEMWQRIANFYPIWYEPRLLASYRENPMKEYKKAGKSLMRFRRSIEIAETYLPPEKGLTETARLRWALFGIRRAYRMCLNKEWEATGILLRESFNLSTAPPVLKEWKNLFSGFYPYNFTGIPQWQKLPGDFSLEKAIAIQTILKNLPVNCRFLELAQGEGKSTVAITHGMPYYSKLTTIIPLLELKQKWGNHLNEQEVIEKLDQILKQFNCREQIKILGMAIEQTADILKEELFEIIFLNFPLDFLWIILKL